MPNKPEEFPVFSNIDKKTIDQMAVKMKSFLENFSSVYKLPAKEVIYKEDVLIKVFEHVEKYRVYFHVFHNGDELGEFNEGALFCYWIVKLHPFYHPQFNTNDLNAKIAICLFINAIYYYSERTKSNKRISRQLTKNLYYSLRFS
ncbi:MAG: hypothetical protein LBH42_03870, partial [Treponema sp.]|nr:hypothetical protein [Treponema sp.]